MSRSAVLMLTITLLSLAVVWLYPELDATPELLLKWIAGICGVAFVLALAVGRRYKFDPILR